MSNQQDRWRDPTAWIPVILALAGSGWATSERAGRTDVEARSQAAIVALVQAQQQQAATYEARLAQCVVNSRGE